MICSALHDCETSQSQLASQVHSSQWHHQHCRHCRQHSKWRCNRGGLWRPYSSCQCKPAALQHVGLRGVLECTADCNNKAGQHEEGVHVSPASACGPHCTYRALGWCLCHDGWPGYSGIFWRHAAGPPSVRDADLSPKHGQALGSLKCKGSRSCHVKPVLTILTHEPTYELEGAHYAKPFVARVPPRHS